MRSKQNDSTLHTEQEIREFVSHELNNLRSTYDQKIAGLEEDLADLADAFELQKSIHVADEMIPDEFVARIVAGEHPIKVYRTYRGLTQSALAQSCKIPQGLLSEIENRKKRGSIDTLQTIAGALKIDLTDLVED